MSVKTVNIFALTIKVIVPQAPNNSELRGGYGPQSP